jgi:glycosyltransferase involved in cell wall biosynthesis
MKVDVVIPTYNGLPWLKETVESVLAQTHKDLTLYIIDDGSTDEGATERYAKSLQDPRVRYFKKPNGGQATARNFGIKKSTAPYIALLDSDDIWYPQKLEKQLKVLKANPKLGLVYGHHDFIDEKGNKTSKLELSNRGNIVNKLLEGNVIAGSGSMVLIPRSVFDKVGLFHEDFLIGEDWEMWLRIAMSYPVDLVPECIAGLRERTDGMQRDFSKMANGLLYMLPVMTKELSLSPTQKRHLKAGLLWRAAIFFFDDKNYGQARRCLLGVWWNWPAYLLRSANWPFYVRAFLGGKYLGVKSKVGK